jgi:hypothetical protein
MKRLIAAAFVAALAAAPAGAATLYVGHGIDGRDLGLSRELPVDICLVAGGTPTPLFTDVTFGQFARIDADLPAGSYDVEVRLADGPACAGGVAIAASISLGLGENATAFAHLNDGGAPTLTKFTNDVRAITPGATRIVARHAAAFGAVDVSVGRGSRGALIRGLENGKQAGADIRPGNWTVSIFPEGSWRNPAFSADLVLQPFRAQFAYAVGTPGNGTFTVLLQELPLGRSSR